MTATKSQEAERRGALIVVEGLDRAGKSSQCESLLKSLQGAGHAVKYIRFPGLSSGSKIYSHNGYSLTPDRQSYIDWKTDRQLSTWGIEPRRPFYPPPFLCQ